MILCCGEALIDMIPMRGPDGQIGFAPHCGGAIFNTAIALGRLGTHAGMLTGLSRDLFGRQLDAGLRASKVDTSLVVTSDRPTTLAFVEVTNGHAKYTFYDENSAGRMMAADEVPPLPNAVSTLYFGGISLCNPPAADSFTDLAAREAGRRVIMLDPNIRPGFTQDIEAYRARLDRMISFANIIKVSDEDLNWIDPAADTLTDKVRRLLAKGPSVVIMTRGSAGATGYCAGGAEVSITARKATVVDTVGAGDTFNAGVLARAEELGLLVPGALNKPELDQLGDCLAFGARVAAVTVSRAGANPPWRHELDA